MHEEREREREREREGEGALAIYCDILETGEREILREMFRVETEGEDGTRTEMEPETDWQRGRLIAERQACS